MLTELSYPSFPYPGETKKPLFFFFPISVLEKRLVFIFMFFASVCCTTNNYCIKLSLSVRYRSEEPHYFRKREEFKRNLRYSPIYNVMTSLWVETRLFCIWDIIAGHSSEAVSLALIIERKLGLHKIYTISSPKCLITCILDSTNSPKSTSVADLCWLVFFCLFLKVQVLTPKIFLFVMCICLLLFAFRWDNDEKLIIP